MRRRINFQPNIHGTFSEIYLRAFQCSSMAGISDGANPHSIFSFVVRIRFGSYASFSVRAFILSVVVVVGSVVAIFTIDPV